MSVKLGDEVKDTITDFKGTVNGRAEYLSGCVRVEVVSRKLNSEGNRIFAWIDENHLKMVKPATKPKRAPTGGPCCDPPH